MPRMRANKDKSIVVKQIELYLLSILGHVSLNCRALNSLTSYLLFSHHAWFFCNLSIKSGMTPACSSDETMLFIWRPWKLNLRHYLSWLSVLLDKQQNNVQASPWLQLTTFQLRDNLVPSEDNVIALEQTPNVCGWPEAARQNMSFFFF